MEVDPTIGDEQNEPKAFIYLDTNVISYLARGDLPNLVPNILDAGSIPIVSDVVLEEVKKGCSSGEIEFIDQNGFWFASAHEALFLNGRQTFYTKPVEIDSDSSNFVEVFLRKFVRSIAGSASVGDLTPLLLDAAKSLLREVEEDLPSETDPRLLEMWDQYREILRKKFDELENLPEPVKLDEELVELQNFAKIFGSLKPPRIIDQIVDIIGLGNADFLVDMTKPFAQDENIKARIQILCMTLVCMGFARGKGLANDSEPKSEAAARSQFSDAYHIAAAATCNVFVTADGRCAKLAYAVYEALSFRTIVCLVRPKNVDPALAILGEDFWP